MATVLSAVDVVLVGFGMTAAIVAQELTDEGLTVLALERGGYRDTIPDFAPTHIRDKLRYAVRHELFQEPRQSTITFRNNRGQVALPMRQLGSFNPGNGVGGAMVHWNGQTWRFLPADFRLRRQMEERYGADFMPGEMTIQDWGVTYDELETHYDRFERLCGTSGFAGNIDGTIREGGNPFEGRRSADYPLPPLERSYATVMFDDAAKRAGFHPFPCPASNASRPYRNLYGVQLGQCTFCGFCEWFGCGNYSKASTQTTILPVLLEKDNFAFRSFCNVIRVNRDPGSDRVTGVTYVDAHGREVVQPAEMVVLCTYAHHNAHLMLLSGIGEPYDPATGRGNVGRNYAYQITSGVEVFTDEILNPFMGAGALGQAIDDFNGDNFDHGPHGFVGGGYIALWSTGGRPILQMHVPEGTPTWGSAWKKAVHESYLTSSSIATHGSVMSYRENYLDLDPTYRDAYGSPLLRLTFGFHENERRMSAFLTERAVDIAREMPIKSYNVNRREGPYSIVPYQTTHNTGGTIMGEDPATSVVNRYLQSWDAPNLFVIGASVFPQNPGYNPTDTVGALTYWAVVAIRGRYLQRPGPLA